MEQSIARVVSELELHHQNTNDPLSQTPISESTLLDIQFLFQEAIDAEDIDRILKEFASNNLSPASLVDPIAATMDSTNTHLSILASQVYLTILLCPNSPVFTLFTPIAFGSLVRSVLRVFKQKPGVGADGGGSGGQKGSRKRKAAGRGRGSKKAVHDSDDGVDGENDGNVFDVRVVFPILEKLESVLCLIHLDRFPDSLKCLVQTIAEIPVIAFEFCESMVNYNRVLDNCFRILIGALRPEHGDPTVTYVEVFKSLSPSILLPKSQIRTCFFRFLTNELMGVAKENENLRKVIVYLPRYLVEKAPDRAEPRAIAVESIMEIVRAMELDHQLGFVDYVAKMSQGKSHLRLLAVDIIPIILMSFPNPLGADVAIGGENWWGLRCLEALVLRCSDAVAGIRAKALSNLAQVVEFLSHDVKSRDKLKEIMGFDSGRCNLEVGLNDLLRKRCLDEKSNVRKAALLLIMKSTALLSRSVDEVLLKTMGIACSDPLVSIRKAAMSALSEVFRKFSDENVILEWLHSIPRLITDNESSIQEECENLFLELVLDRISRVGSMSSVSTTTSSSSAALKGKSLERETHSVFPETHSVFPEGVLILLKGICNTEVTPCLKKICTNLGKKKRLKSNIAVALQNIIRTSESIWLVQSMPIEKWTAPPGAWFLLSEVSSFLPKAVTWEFLDHHWQLLDKTELDNEIPIPLMQSDVFINGEDIETNSAAWARDRVFLLQTICNVSLELPPEPAADLAHNLLKRVEGFNMHLTEVNAHVKALRTLCKRNALDSQECDDLVGRWVNQLVSKALRIIEAYITEASEASKASGYRTPPKSVGRKWQKTAAASKMLLQTATAVYTVGSLVIISPLVELKGIIPLLHTIITSGNSQTKLKKPLASKLNIEQQAPSLYIQSWLTMGKICLADAELAKSYIPLFVQELEKNDSAALRSNIVVMMADFCVRYTALVDGYISKITNCLRDTCEVVRRQTFILLSRLLQRDYVKWRGVLFLRFLLCLVDESEKIRQLADFLFGNILKAKAPLLAYNSFVEAIFVLNDCHAHAGRSNSNGSRAESKLFSIRGNDKRSRTRRMHIYVSLLKQMAPEHLLATFVKLCAEILAGASDRLLNLDDTTGQAVLQDALEILACKEIRVQSSRGSASDSAEMDDEDGESGGTDAAAAAKRREMVQVAKKSLIQNAIPIFIELKRLLESRNSPMMGCLMECLRALLKDYKNEIDDILVADKQLQKELLYDMEKYEALKAKSTVAETVATMQKSNSNMSPLGRASGASKVARDVQGRLAQQLGSPEKVSSVMSDATATKTVKSMLKEASRDASASQLVSMNRPLLKSSMRGANSRGDHPLEVLESLRRKQNFDTVNKSVS